MVVNAHIVDKSHADDNVATHNLLLSNITNTFVQSQLNNIKSTSASNAAVWCDNVAVDGT
ncbi:hypothetical protein IKS57_01875 [bacterium]|nr:hypothetical protein [bacterium]